MSIKLINSFIVSSIDYQDNLLVGPSAGQLDDLDHIQSILNCRIIYGRGKYNHVTPFLRHKLHWLRVPQRMQYKSNLLMYKVLNGLLRTYPVTAKHC